MKAIQIETFGNPAEVARAVDIPEPSPPAEKEIVIELQASPINPYDLLMIAGAYGYRPSLPAIMGTEGAGRVIAVGKRVKHLKEGDRTTWPYNALLVEVGAVGNSIRADTHDEITPQFWQRGR